MRSLLLYNSQTSAKTTPSDGTPRSTCGCRGRVFRTQWGMAAEQQERGPPGAGRGSNREKGLSIKRANLICSSEQLEEQDAEYNQRRKAAMSSSEGQPCPICLDDMSDDGGGRALVCGHRVHRKCWDAMLSAHAKDSSADAPTPHCPVCRAWQGGESTADTSSKRWYEQSSEELVTGLLGFMFQSRSVEETGFDGAMAARARSP